MKMITDDFNNPYNNGIKVLEQMGFELADLILANTSGLAKQIEEEYKIESKKIVINSYKDRKFTDNVVENYQQKLNNTKARSKK